jgi:hypothetical protein
MCWNGQNTMILYIKRQYRWKHILIVKDFIVDIGHGLNGNKFMNTTNVYSPQQKEYTYHKKDWNNTQWRKNF